MSDKLSIDDYKVFYWHTDSPDAGDPGCICDLCEQPISEEQAPAIRVWSHDQTQETRFHIECYQKINSEPYKYTWERL